MDDSTPANRSRIPKVNFSVPRIRRSTSLSSIPGAARQTPSAGEKSVFVRSNLLNSYKVTAGSRHDPFRKPLEDNNGLRTKTAQNLKRPLNSVREDGLERKKQALAPPSNQTSKPKIASWDIKGKLKHAEENLSKLKERVAELTVVTTDQGQQLGELKKQRTDLEKEVKEKTSALDSTNRCLLETEENLERLKIQYAVCDSSYKESTLSLEKMGQTLALKEQTLSVLHKEVDALRAGFNELETAFSEQCRHLMEVEASLKSYQGECVKLKEHIVVQEVKRKVLHNRVMELKGNIRVFCRVRPLLSSEMTEQKCVEHLIFNDENSLEVVKGPKKTKSSFSYDRVFSPSSKQTDVFEELSELVQSVIDGYNVCVFAYGQTGSGKTYTMEGGFSSEERGMIPRSIDHIFAVLDDSITMGWKYKAEASFLEIYNEQIRDLLDVGQVGKPCEIRNPLVPGGDMVITNLKVEVVTSASQVNSLLNIAKTNRAVAATFHNDYSSRSHFVFKLRLMGENAATGKSSDAVLSLVDLAGSERLVEISENARVAETKNINRSLSNLGNVILALSRKNEHVPYRNSKLTHLLQTSLGGNSKTLMLVNLSPKEDSVDETLNSLRFAARVNDCHVGRANRLVR